MIIFLGLFYLAILAVGLRFLIHGYGLMGNFLRRARPTNRLQGQPEARCNSMPCHCGCCYATCLVQGVALHLVNGGGVMRPVWCRALLCTLQAVGRCYSTCLPWSAASHLASKLAIMRSGGCGFTAPVSTGRGGCSMRTRRWASRHRGRTPPRAHPPGQGSCVRHPCLSQGTPS